ncbi:alcohol dehydrogenase catalytic domain-containing protein [Trichococcus collinsii]|uniref:NADPH:quinone reductase n=1 Tax=Trichococcus collinsii TaxID=157076 RepID=A0AB38A3L8_9LACT|nr:zinc-binding dehydrogenase [Trichococcus collinsii]CZR02074.1 enoylreductase [Trichococcus collinsii]SEA91763.1 NADPH:quinone reductase [Trichococcus collinsii]
MKAVVVHEAGGPEKLVYQEVTLPEMREGWSLVKVMGFGINHSEIFTREGKSPSVRFPRILGIECVGIVERSSDAEKLPLGQKVVSIMGGMGRAFDGSYAEYVLIPNDQIYPVHTDLPWDQLAAIPETYYTAFGSMKNLKIQASDQILVRGATSGVGVAFAKLVKAQFPDIRIYGSTRKAEKGLRLKKAGFTDFIEDRNGVLETEETFDKILELIGPETIKDSLSHIREAGIVCSTGQLGGKWFLEDFDPIMELKHNSYLTTFHSSEVSGEKLNELLAYIEGKGVAVEPEKVLTLEEVAQAHAFLQSQDSFGKFIVLDPSVVGEQTSE